MSLAQQKFSLGLFLIACLITQGGPKAWAQADEYNDREYHASQADAQRQCSDSQEWNSERNMCVTTADSKERRDDIRECSEIEDDEARKKCHEDIASRETGVSQGDEYSDSGILDMSIPVLTAALSGTMMYAAEETFGSCTSLKIMGATSVIGLASEFMYKKEAKDNLEKLQDDYEKETASDEAYHAQKRAFEFLKKEQELIAEFEEKRRNTMYLMTAGFGIAAITALTADRMITNCGSGEEKKEPGQDTADTDTSDTAELEGEGDSQGERSEADSDELAEQTTLGKLNTPTTVAITSGASAVATMVLGAEAAKQAKNASENAKIVQDMIDKFEADFEQFCPQGREDMEDPACFCYNLDGTKNQDRSNSQTCQNYWAQRDKNLFAEAGDYSSSEKSGPAQGCAFFNGNFDKDCECKKRKNKKGENACLKTGVPASVAGNLSGAVPLPRVLGNLNRAAEGGISEGVFNPDQLASDAKATNRVARNAIKKALEEKTGKKAPSPEDILANRLKKIPKSAVKAMNEAMGGSARGMAALSRPQTPELKEAMKKAGVDESAPGSDSKIGYKSGSDLRRGQKKKEEDEGYFRDWGDSSSTGNSGEELTFMDKKYEYQQNDIVERDDISLWEIISRRYTKTGLRRLFPDEEQPLEDLN